MGGFVIGGLLVLVVLALSAAVYRWGMARTSEPRLGRARSRAWTRTPEIVLERGRARPRRLAGSKGLITPAEHHEQRTVILRSI